MEFIIANVVNSKCLFLIYCFCSFIMSTINGDILNRHTYVYIAKRERRQPERKWRNTKLSIFKDLYGQAKHKVSILVHTAKCKFYTERIALASSSKELHQIVNTLSNRHPPKILPTIYPSADLPSIFIKHFTNKAEKLRANIASEHVTSTLVTGTTAATFSSFEKCHN